MTGRQCHAWDVGDIPRGDDDAARVGCGFELFDDLGELVDVAALAVGPAAPLVAVDGAEAAVFCCPFVPNTDAAFGEPVVVGVALDEPEQFLDDGFDVDFFGGDEREALREVEAHLVAKNRACACACAVGFVGAVVHDVAHEVEVVLHVWVWVIERVSCRASGFRVAVRFGSTRVP